MNNPVLNEDGKALGIILGVVGGIIVIIVLVLVLTVTGSVKYPPSAVNWPGVGSFIAQYGSIMEIMEDEAGTEDPLPGTPSSESIMAMGDNDVAKIVRDLSFKKQRIDELEGQIETKDDQIAKLEEDMQSMKTQLENYKPENRKALIKIYDRMEADAAVEILSQIPPERAVIILSSLKDSKAAEILSLMDKDAALKITELMAGFQPSTGKGLRERLDDNRVIQPTSPRMQTPSGNAPPPMTPESLQGTIGPDGQVIAPADNSDAEIVGPPPPPEEEEKEKKDSEKTTE